MRKIVIVALASIGTLAAGAAYAQEDLAKANGCLNCHAADTKKVGPSWKDISAKYKGKPDAEAKLVTALTTGKGHPAVKAKPDDVTKLVKWVLSQ
jgi:cytochrome c